MRGVRNYVRKRKEEIGMLKRETFIPQCYEWGSEAQVDWYEAYIQIEGQMQKVAIFSMRSMASGAAFHRAYGHATQQAFLEAHQAAFHYFGGVFQRIRYDNLASAVKKILQGYQREETTRFIAFRSHWQFAAEFCRPGKQGAHEKGGVEGEIGYFRRNHLVPIPCVENLEQLNKQLLADCDQDKQRVIGQRKLSVGAAMVMEEEHLLPLASTDFELAEESFYLVDMKGCVKVRTNFYSVPCHAGFKVRVRVLPIVVEILRDGELIASHQRCYGRGEEILNLEHYLDVLEHKPGALAGSKPLQQWRAAGRWPKEFDLIWQDLQARLGKSAGTRAMIELLQLGREYGYEQLSAAINQARALGCSDSAAIRHLINAPALAHLPLQEITLGALVQYQRPLPQIGNYDQLLEVTQ